MIGVPNLYLYFVWFVGSLDVLTMAQQANLTVVEETKEKQATSKVYTKDDFTMVNRFESEYISDCWKSW